MSVKRNTSALVACLILLSLVGVGFGVWLFRAHFVLLGCLYIGVWLWNAQRFALWLVTPTQSTTPTPNALGGIQPVILAIVCLAAAGISSWGAYWWYLS